MPLRKLQLKPGVNKENTRYANENGWYDCDKVRFRQGTPEKIGGWQRVSSSTFLGVCRSLWNWVTLGELNLVGVGTHLKFYIESGGAYNDITPIRKTSNLTNPIATVNGSSTVTITDTSNGANVGDFVNITNNASPPAAVVFNGVTLFGNYRITEVVNADSYKITGSGTANASGTGGGSVVVKYEIYPGTELETPFVGWSAGTWGEGTWGNGGTSNTAIRLWSQSNYGEDLIFCPRGSKIYYWDASDGLTTRAVELSTRPGADAYVPSVCNFVFVSDTNRFVFAFGCNDIGSGALDPMLIRWSDQENAVKWYPGATNQAGSLRLSHGSQIIGCVQTRQEIVVFTDASVYSLQYLGPPIVWGSQLLGDNISIQSQNCMVQASGVVYWMGVDKFYVYDGRVQTLPCDLRRYVFNDFNYEQKNQVFAGTNEGYNEIWWFYCSANATRIDRYVVYNYIEKVWYHGTLSRSAWLDTDLRSNPIAASYDGRLINHEVGLNNGEGADPAPIHAYISSAEFDIEDGDRFGFVWRMLPDVTFDGSTAASPTATMTLIPMRNSGSGYNDPRSEGGVDNAAVVRTATAPIEKFTGQVYIRVRGRQMILKMESNQLDTTWQLGHPRLDIRQDGRR